MELKQRIIAYIIKNAPVTLDTIIEQATSKGYPEFEVLNTLEQVHKDKRIKQTTRGDTIVYALATHKEPKPQTHLQWLRDHYPQMDSTNDGSGIDIGDLSWMFLKTKEERDAFRAEMSGKLVGYNKRYGKNRIDTR